MTFALTSRARLSPVVLLVAAELKAEGPVTRRALWHVALNNIIAMLGVTLLLPFIEARDASSAWSPAGRALWLVAGSFMLGYAAFWIARLLARFTGKSDAPQFILIVGMMTIFMVKYRKKEGEKSFYTHGNHKLEMIWTITPAITLIVIALIQANHS